MSAVEPPVDPPARPPLDHRDATYYAIPRRRHPLVVTFVWLVVAIAGLAFAGVLFAERLSERALNNEANNSPEVKEAAAILATPPKKLPDQPTNILVIGSDSRGKNGAGGGRSDTLILVRLDYKRNFISMLSFPRDLYVTIPGHGQNKINAAYSFGNNKLAIQTVQQLTGEPIHYFFNVDFNAFVQLVNDVHGVYLDVDRWYFNDNSGSGESYEQLDIKPGYQKLRGAEALDYVRYRHGDSDLARAARQQSFLSELKRETHNAAGIDNIIDAIHDNVTTNLRDAGRLRSFLQFGMTIEKERIARATVGSSGAGSTSCCGSVLFTSPKLIANAVDRWKNPEFITETPATALPPSKVNVVVFNGSNRLRLGTAVGDALAARGYNVEFGGNAPEGFYGSTSIFYAPGKREEARALQALFGDTASIAQRRAGQQVDADLLVMVGGDFGGLRRPQRQATVKEQPQVIATTSLRRVVQNARAVTKMDLLVPTHLPPGSEVRYVRLYNVEHGDQKAPNALTLVIRLGGQSSLGGNRYMTITQTSMKNPPIVGTATGQDKRGGGFTFYDGKKMQRLLWQRGNMTYWISNSLDESLSATTIRDIRQFMVRPGRVRVPKGQVDVHVAVTERGRTP